MGKLREGTDEQGRVRGLAVLTRVGLAVGVGGEGAMLVNLGHHTFLCLEVVLNISL